MAAAKAMDLNRPFGKGIALSHSERIFGNAETEPKSFRFDPEPMRCKSTPIPTIPWHLPTNMKRAFVQLAPHKWVIASTGRITVLRCEESLRGVWQTVS